MKIGLIGCGTIGRFHARNIRDAVAQPHLHEAGFSYHGVCDRDPARAAAFGQIGRCPLITQDSQQLINECDVVYVCTETSEHPTLVDAALAQGRHIFCEKPLARDLATVESMAARVNDAGVVHQVGLVLRFSPVVRVLEDLIATHDFGRLMTAHLRDDQFFPVRGHYASTWRGDVNKAGAGTLLEHSIHDVDLFLRLFGEVTTVRAWMRPSAEYPGIEDLALVTFEHQQGTVATLSSIWHDIDSRASSRRLEMFFERGYLCTEQDYFGSITVQSGTGAPLVLTPEDVFARFIKLEGLDQSTETQRSIGGLGDRRFLEAILYQQQALPDFSTATDAHRVVSACYEQAQWV